MRELKTLIAVAQAGTFAAAGARVGLSQSAVSAQMQRLEELLGTELFTRTGRSATLNSVGHEAIPLAQEILDLFDRMGDRLSSGTLRGQLRVGAIQTVQLSLLPDAIRAMHEQHPDIALKLVHGSSLALIGQIDSGELDAALMVAPPFELPPDLAWTPLLREPYLLMAPRDWDVDPSDWRSALTNLPFIRYDRGSFGGRSVERFLRRHGIHPRSIVDLEDVDAMVRMVSRGLGVALIPKTRSDYQTESIRLIDLGEQTFFRDIGLLTRKEPDRRNLVQVFQAALLTHVTRVTVQP